MVTREGPAAAYLGPDALILLGCLIALIVSLLLVGVVSGTPVRHVIQVIPIAVAAVLTASRPKVGPYAAMPLFVFWFLIVGLIWMYLLGLSDIASGTYSTVEIILTLCMAIASLVGVRVGRTAGWGLSLPARISTAALFVALQIGAMWVSFLPQFANR